MVTGRNMAVFRFYEELNDFLPPDRRKRDILYAFDGSPTVKDAVEAQGVPHTEVDLILVNGESVGFGHHLRTGDRVSVYPVFESFDIGAVTRLRAEPLRETKFILDVHLGKLARWLRMLGFDTAYRNDYDDPEIVRTALAEQRIILTRDIGILKTGAVTHGYWLRSTDPEEQVREVIRRFDLRDQIQPFHRCMACNGIIAHVEKEEIRSQLLPRTATYYHAFFRCTDCGKIYWKGSHFKKMKRMLEKWRTEAE